MPKLTTKRKEASTKGPSSKRVKGQKQPSRSLDWGDDDEELDSDFEEEAENKSQKNQEAEAASSDDDDEDIDETVEDKRLRLAKRYLDQIKGSDEDSDGSDDEGESEGEEMAKVEGLLEGEENEDRIATKLKIARLHATGRIRHMIADNLDGDEVLEPSRWMTGHKLPLTCVGLTHDDRHCFTGSKDNAVYRYDVQTGKKVGTIIKPWKKANGGRAFEQEVLCLAVSPDSRTLATGGRDKLVRLFDIRTDATGPVAHIDPASEGSLSAFRGHKDYITALAFDLDATSTLYSASADRLLKVWNAKERGYMDTLFGHQSDIVGLDALRRETLMTVGRDRTARYWKVSDEKQLVFRGSVQSSSIDCVRMLTPDTFVTGDDRGYISIWGTQKKKAVMDMPGSSPLDDPFLEEEQAVNGQFAHRHRPWITSLSSVRTADLIASGSSDGYVRLWKATSKPVKTLSQVGAVAVKGFANGLAFSSDGKFLLCAMGQEHRLGRWERITGGAKNGLAFVPLPYSKEDSNSEDDSDEDEDDAEE